MKIWKLLFYILGSLPLGYTISLMAFYLHAKQVLGYTPAAGLPDPKELNIYSDYHPFIHWIGEIWLYSFLVWVILIIIYLGKYGRETLISAPVIFSCIGQFCGIDMFLSDISVWYMD